MAHGSQRSRGLTWTRRMLPDGPLWPEGYQSARARHHLVSFLSREAKKEANDVRGHHANQTFRYCCRRPHGRIRGGRYGHRSPASYSAVSIRPAADGAGCARFEVKLCPFEDIAGLLMGMPDDEADGEAGREEEEGGEGEEEGCPSAGGGGGRDGGRGGGQQRGLFCHRRSRRERVLAVVYNYLCRARRSPMGNDGDRRRLQPFFVVVDFFALDSTTLHHEAAPPHTHTPPRHRPPPRTHPPLSVPAPPAPPPASSGTRSRRLCALPQLPQRGRTRRAGPHGALQAGPQPGWRREEGEAAEGWRGCGCGREW